MKMREEAFVSSSFRCTCSSTPQLTASVTSRCANRRATLRSLVVSRRWMFWYWEQHNQVILGSVRKHAGGEHTEVGDERKGREGRGGEGGREARRETVVPQHAIPLKIWVIRTNHEKLLNKAKSTNDMEGNGWSATPQLEPHGAHT